MSNYSSNLNCEWLVENPQHINSSIVVLLEDLHVQEEQTCGKDYLQFRLGGSNRSTSVCCCQRNGSSFTRCSLELEAPERLEIIRAVRRLLFLSASRGAFRLLLACW